MTVLTFPTLTRNPSAMTWRLRALTQTHTSPLDGTMQTLRQPGERWAVSVTWPSLMEADRRALDAFLASLGGMAGRFTFSAATHAPRRATGTGTILINGAGQSGSTLAVDGFGAAHQAFLAGDFLSYADTGGRHRLHMVTADVTANGSGQATVAIAPPIRRAGADNAAVNITAPVGVFMLTEDEASIAVRPPLLGSVSLELIEALV